MVPVPGLSEDLQQKIKVSLQDSEDFDKEQSEIASEIRKARSSIPRFQKLFGMGNASVLGSIYILYIKIKLSWQLYCYLCCLYFLVLPFCQLTLFLQGQLALRRLAKEQQCEAEDPDKLYKDELSDDEPKKQKGKGRGRGRGRSKAKPKPEKSPAPPAETKVDIDDSKKETDNSKENAAQQKVEDNQIETGSEPVPNSKKKTKRLKRAATSGCASSPRELRRTKSKRLNLLRSMSKSPKKRLPEEVQGVSEQAPGKGEQKAEVETAPKPKRQKKPKASEKHVEAGGSSGSLELPKPAEPGSSDPPGGEPKKKEKHSVNHEQVHCFN